MIRYKRSTRRSVAEKFQPSRRRISESRRASRLFNRRLNERLELEDLVFSEFHDKLRSLRMDGFYDMGYEDTEILAPYCYDHKFAQEAEDIKEELIQRLKEEPAFTVTDISDWRGTEYKDQFECGITLRISRELTEDDALELLGSIYAECGLEDINGFDLPDIIDVKISNGSVSIRSSARGWGLEIKITARMNSVSKIELKNRAERAIRNGVLPSRYN